MMTAMETGKMLQTLDQSPTWDDWRAQLRTSLPSESGLDESWKYTRIKSFEGSGNAQSAVGYPLIQIPRQRFPGFGTGTDWWALSFRQAFEKDPDLLIPRLGQASPVSGRVLYDSNTKAFEDGILIEIPDGVVVHEPIKLFLDIENPIDSADHSGNRVYPHFPRVLIHLGGQARASVIEYHRWGQESPTQAHQPNGSPLHRVTAVTEILLDPGAALTHYLEQTGGENIQAAGQTLVRLGRESHYTGYAFDTLAPLLRHEHHLFLAEPGSEARLEGLTLAGRREHHDRQSSIVHASPGTSSHQCFYSIVAGQAISIYGGQVLMRPGASGCNATQKNHHLLLDPSAQSRSRPSLEIAVDDVRCSHGSTSGALDPESVFYLRSRGLDEKQARHLLTLAFAGDFLEKLPLDSLKTAWQQAINRALPEME